MMSLEKVKSWYKILVLLRKGDFTTDGDKMFFVERLKIYVLNKI